jgi:ABC-type transporter Mla subunit MlaD
MNIVKTFNHLLNSLKTSPLGIFNFVYRLENLLKEIIMNQKQLEEALATVQSNQEATQATLDKVMTEVQSLITALANTNNELDPAVSAAVDKLIATSGTVLNTAQALDTMNPDKVEDLSGGSPS